MEIGTRYGLGKPDLLSARSAYRYTDKIFFSQRSRNSFYIRNPYIRSMIQPYAVHPMRSVFSPTTPLLPTFLHEDVVVGSYLPTIAYQMAPDCLFDSVLLVGKYAFTHNAFPLISESLSGATLAKVSLAGEEEEVDEELDDEDLDEEEDEEDDFDEIEEDIDEEDLEGLEEEFEDEEFDEEEDDDLDDDDDDDDLEEDIAEDDDL